VGYKDSCNHWAAKEISRAAELGLLRGYPDGTFKPEAQITRAEAAVLATRLYDATKETFEDLVSRVEPAVVTVINEDTGSIGSGTSIGRGFILTNAHVVLDDGGKTSFQYGIRWTGWGYGEEGNAQYAMGPCVHADPLVDLAIVRADIVDWRERMPVLPLGDPKTVQRGMTCAVVGSPLGLAGTVTAGIVSFVGRKMSYDLAPGLTATVEDLIQVDAPINPGNSGGALVNRQGELIGVPSVKLAAVGIEGLGFAIGLDTVRKVIVNADKSGVLAAAYRKDLVAALDMDEGLTMV
jgi:serine protease Do